MVRLIITSTRVAGGVGPCPSHATESVAQSAVSQWNFLVSESAVQPVRPQKRPDHECEVDRSTDLPSGRWKPVWFREGVPAPESVPTQTGYWQLLVNSKIVVVHFIPGVWYENALKIRYTYVWVLKQKSWRCCNVQLWIH